MLLKNQIAEITSTGNVFDADSNGDGRPVEVIQATASANTSACVLVDDDGVEIARFESAVAGVRTYPPLQLNGKVIKGMSCDLFTNMTKVIVHFAR